MLDVRLPRRNCWRSFFLVRHTVYRMVKPLLCQSCRTQASFNFVGSKPAYCKKHAEDGMVNVRNRRCLHDSCSKYPCYNFKGSTPAMYCKSHSQDGMVNILSPRCVHDSCAKKPSFNFRGLKKTYCKQHAAEGMVNVCKKRCLHCLLYTSPSPRD